MASNAPTSWSSAADMPGRRQPHRLRLRNDVDITLINPRPKFVERIRLHQLVAGNYDATVDYGTVLGDGVELVVDQRTEIDIAAERCSFVSGGAQSARVRLSHLRGRQHGRGAHVCTWCGGIRAFDRGIRVRAVAARHGRQVASRCPVTVVGAGLTGIEAASELAEQGRAVTLVCGGQLAPSLSEGGSRSIAKWFAKHGVAVLEDDVVTEVRADAVVFADGAVRPSAVTIWTAGFGVPDLAAASGLRTDATGAAAHRRDAHQRRRRAHRRSR